MSKDSKPIRKTDDSAMALMHEIFNGKEPNIADIDSYYCVKGNYYFMEFIKCIKTRPNDYDPNQNWKEIHHHISTVWDFAGRAKGILWLICYEELREQFNIYQVKHLDETKIEFEKNKKINFAEFKEWFQKINQEVLAQ